MKHDMKLKNFKLGILLAVLMASLLLVGCSVHRINEKPQVDVKTRTAFSVASEDVVFRKPWWQSLNRPALNELIQQALVNNYNVAQTVAILEQTRAVARQTAANRLPQIGLSGNANKLIEGSSFQGDTLGLNLELDWEIDLWNRIGTAAKADRLEAQARVADIDFLKLTLTAEVANAYFGAVAAKQQIILLTEQVKLDQELQRILKLRLKNGVGTNVEVLQQLARVADSETLIPLAEADLAVFENRLDVLLGEQPDGKFRVAVDENLAFSSTLPAIGVPSALLLNRPDLVAMRTELIAADADIGVAIADRFPRVTLLGVFGYEDSDSNVGSAAALAVGFVQPLLDWGQRKAEVKRNKALYRERLAAYTQLYLEAVEDVENALVQENKQREFLVRLNQQKKVLQQAVNAADRRFKQGVDDYQPVIAILQELRDVERDLVEQQLILINIRIELFRAIGGPIKQSGQITANK